MNISSATNSRTLICALSNDLPCNHSLNPLRTPNVVPLLALSVLLNSFILDAQVRVRLGGLNVSFFVLDEVAALRPTGGLLQLLIRPASALSLSDAWFSPTWLRIKSSCPEASWRAAWAVTPAERLRHRALSDALVAAAAGLNMDELCWLLRNCDGSREDDLDLSPKGFWRVDRDKDPELRHPVMTLVAFHDLQTKIAECNADRDKGIEAFVSQNDGEGWRLPETLRLADYSLGHNERAREHQPVASRLGPRFYNWQLAQEPDESWRECHLHARNLLGGSGYRRFVNEFEADGTLVSSSHPSQAPSNGIRSLSQTSLFDGGPAGKR